MSHRRWRQIVAPGVSPGFRCQIDYKARFSGRQSRTVAQEFSVAPTGLIDFFLMFPPGLRPGLHSAAR